MGLYGNLATGFPTRACCPCWSPCSLTAMSSLDPPDNNAAIMNTGKILGTRLHSGHKMEWWIKVCEVSGYVSSDGKAFETGTIKLWKGGLAGLGGLGDCRLEVSTTRRVTRVCQPINDNLCLSMSSVLHKPK